MNRKFNIVAAMAAVIFGFVFYGQATAQTDNKIAVIYSDLFMDGKSGIAKLSVISDSLNREFEPRKTEINQLTQKA